MSYKNIYLSIQSILDTLDKTSAHSSDITALCREMLKKMLKDNTDLTYADLTYADLTSADLTGASAGMIVI